MGGIDDRPRKDGTVMYRVRIRVKGIRFFSLTFDDWGHAVDWLDKNEDEFVKDPEYYFDWKDRLMKDMRSNKIKKMGNVIKSWKRRIR